MNIYLFMDCSLNSVISGWCVFMAGFCLSHYSRDVSLPLVVPFFHFDLLDGTAECLKHSFRLLVDLHTGMILQHQQPAVNISLQFCNNHFAEFHLTDVRVLIFVVKC